MNNVLGRIVEPCDLHLNAKHTDLGKAPRKLVECGDIGWMQPGISDALHTPAAIACIASIPAYDALVTSKGSVAKFLLVSLRARFCHKSFQKLSAGPQKTYANLARKMQSDHPAGSWAAPCCREFPQHNAVELQEHLVER